MSTARVLNAGPVLITGAIILSLGIVSGAGQTAEVAPAPRPLTVSSYLGARGYSKLPVHRDPVTNWLLVTGAVGEREGKLVLDCGAVGNTVFVPAGRLGPGNPPKDPTPNRLTVTGFDCDEEFDRHTLDGLAASEAAPVLGLLGTNWMRRRNVLLDYRDDRVYTRPAESAKASGTERFRILLRQEGRVEYLLLGDPRRGQWHVRLRFGAASGVFLVDGGSASNILFSRLADQLGGASAEAAHTIPGVNGLTLTVRRWATHVCDLGDADSATPVPFAVCDPPANPGALSDYRPGIDGVLGAGFLLQYATLLDFDDGRLYCARRAAMADPRLHGAWTVKAIDIGGERIAITGLQTAEVTATGLKLSLGRGAVQYRVVLYPWREPGWIDLIPAGGGRAIPGCYRVDSNSLQLIMPQPDGDERMVRPTGDPARDGPSASRMELVR